MYSKIDSNNYSLSTIHYTQKEIHQHTENINSLIEDWNRKAQEVEDNIKTFMRYI